MRSFVPTAPATDEPIIDPDRFGEPDPGMGKLTEEVVAGLPAYVQPWVGAGIAVVVAFVLTWVGAAVVNRVLRRRPLLRDDIKRARWPLFLLLSCVGTLGSFAVTAPVADWRGSADFLLLATMIAAFAWLVTVLLHLVESILLSKYRSEQSVDARHMAKLRTQVSLLRRVVVAAVLVLAVAGILLLIPEVRALGAGILASAGLISVIAGMAVQSTLSNVFAGLQLAFTDALRVDDTVLVEGSRGNVEEITLTYVVVKLIDDTRMILPSTYFTTTPFRNFSRGTDDVSGGIEIELTWKAPVDLLRKRLEETVAADQAWDGRDASLAVSDAKGGLMTVFIWLTARNAGDLWNLQNSVREELLRTLQQQHPDALPEPVIRGGGA
ncbi:mechanosensitive ion channel domain-containing protein [Zhihengliuella sp.]|uniref:mechanosensitive ion channel family protein n=1 Tax=Zhihengliuella sp. TaxID=1954483 RepID=UPI0028120C67|nr:mechanosensitive ion channel domain-containing protein [Zhihengliuella sp.]